MRRIASIRDYQRESDDGSVVIMKPGTLVVQPASNVTYKGNYEGLVLSKFEKYIYVQNTHTVYIITHFFRNTIDGITYFDIGLYEINKTDEVPDLWTSLDLTKEYKLDRWTFSYNIKSNKEFRSKSEIYDRILANILRVMKNIIKYTIYQPKKTIFK